MRQVLYGIPVSLGIAIGRAYFWNRQGFEPIQHKFIEKSFVQKEIDRLQLAFQKTCDEMETLKKRLPDFMQENRAILDAHLLIAADEKLRNAAKKYIAEMAVNAEWAFEKAFSDIARVFDSIKDEYIKERLQDVRLVVERVLRNLSGRERIKATSRKGIVLAYDLTPADIIELEADKILGIVTALGGQTSHTGIIAKAMKIPAVVGISDLANVDDNTIVILDGFSGRLIVSPEEEELAEYAERIVRYEDFQKEVSRCADLQLYTNDGHRLEVLGNIDLREDIALIKNNGGEGVGLFRTEYAYIGRKNFPAEEELVVQYRQIAEEFFPLPVTIRTIDIGSDKMSAKYDVKEINPALGLRAVRFCLRNKDIFKTQLRTIMRAGKIGNLSILLPLISGVGEFEEVRKIYLEAQEELRREGKDFQENLPLGIMIELPSAVFLAEELAKRADFFSIGTNDLIQYTLGIDRANSAVAYLYQPLHPAVVRSMAYIVEAASKFHIPVCVCGEMASNPFCLPVLVGMGVDQISVNPRMIAVCKRIMRDFSFVQCRDLFRCVVQNATVAENNQLMQAVFQEKFAGEMEFYTAFLNMQEN